jgi:hypothetical protein
MFKILESHARKTVEHLGIQIIINLNDRIAIEEEKNRIGLRYLKIRNYPNEIA